MAEESKKNALPPKDGDAPLQELERDHLSVLLYVAFTGPELMGLMRDLGVSVPGYRTEKLSDSERADVLADEIRAYPKARAAIVELLRKIYEFPALDAVALSPPVAEEIAACAVEEDSMVRLLWRVIADPDPEVRKTTARPLEYLVKRFYGDPDAPRPEPKVKPKAAPVSDAKLAQKAASLEKELERAKEEVAREKEKLEEAKAQLKSLRADVAKAEKATSAVKSEKEKLAAKLEKTEGLLAAAKAKTGKADLERARREAVDATERAAALEDRAKRIAAERDELARELESLRREKSAGGAAAQAPPATPGGDDAPLEEVPATWALPRFTREFYDSIEKWDPRIQRTAFKQAFLLAENHRHPSLRAIPLEGLPGYYRVRIASDVRLIYRRGDRGEVEILSLIDREDLDRYVRQAKTR